MFKRFLLFVLTATLFTSCYCPQNYSPCDEPPYLPDCPVVPRPVRVALVLGGGGSRGLAHVGVIEELVNANIPIDLIIGCSAGSIVGALYADDPSTDTLKDTLLALNTNYLLDIDLWHAKFGLCQGKTLRRFLDLNLTADNFDELKIPFFLVATDLYSSELVTIGGGPLIPAIEASCSLPVIYVPVQLHGRIFVDGGIIDPVPTRVAMTFDPDIIVAVDLRGLLPKIFPTNLFEVLTRSAEIALLWQSEACVSHANVIIRPELTGCGTFDTDINEKIYQAGREAGRQAIPEIIALLQRGTVVPPHESDTIIINQEGVKEIYPEGQKEKAVQL